GCRARGHPLHIRHSDRDLQRPILEQGEGDPLMSTSPMPPVKQPLKEKKDRGGKAANPRAAAAKQRLTSRWATAAAIIIATAWTIPTVALFMTALVPGSRYRTDAWWGVMADGDLTF